MNAFEDLGGILVLEHLHDALHGIGVRVLAEDALPLLVGIGEPTEIADENRHSFALRNDDVPEVRKRAHQADAANDVYCSLREIRLPPALELLLLIAVTTSFRPTPNRWSCIGSISS